MTRPTSGAHPTSAEAAVTAANDFDNAQAIRTAVLRLPDVADLSAGPLGEVASYFSGRRVAGIRVDDEQVEVHIVAVYGRPLPEVADDIGRSVATLLHGRRLRVVVADVALPGETPATPAALPAAE